jgi:hypothetical protein
MTEKTKTTYMIQMNDLEAADMLQSMAREDLRSYGNQVAWLIRQEVDRRNSEDNTTQNRVVRSATKA